ncbi:lipid storage droplets surface-binding protein 2 [Anabrus simplex]|uniref:lipid storage droplets surface-binding protein 2 n=1 Tax=Anabrus simplex TaxID=316456 RepID=UPI0035A3CE90
MAAETVTSQAKDMPQSTLPHLESVDRVKKIPLVEAALNQSSGMYEKVKGSNSLINWTLSTAESTMQKAMDQATPYAAPIAKRLETPINIMDQTFCKGLTMVENKLPIVKEPPQQIYETAKSYVMPTYNKVSAVKDYGTQKAKSLKELSWNKANEVLSTRYGNVAYTSFDTAAAMAEAYLNRLFPATEEELQKEHTQEAVPDGEDRVLHTVHTVGRLSSKFGRRIYHALSNQVKNLNRETVQEYIASLIAVIQLTNYLNAFAQKKTEPTPQTSQQQQPPQQPQTVAVK